MQIDEAREVATKALENLATSLAGGESETLRNYLRAMGKFHRYSAANILLIMAQRPNASRVAGYHTWRKLQRQVLRGAHGIMIFAPLVKCAVERSECGVETEISKLVGFRAAVVFDVADTSGDPLPEFARFEGNPGEYLERLKSLVAGSGCSLEYSTDILPARGQCSGAKIVLLPDLSPAEEFHVLTHEFTHARLHFTARRAETTKVVRETEAEAVAFVVSHSIGLDTNSASSDYLKLYDGDTDTLAHSLSHIQQVSTDILARIAPA